MNPWDIIYSLEADNSRLAKEAIIKAQAEAGNDRFFAGCQLALDKLITFGVKKVPESDYDQGQGLAQEEFDVVAKALADRELTGHAALEAIDTLMSTATKEEWNDWYRRILIKDLRCGVSEKTINSVCKSINKDYMVPVFGCQLAHDSANHEKKVVGRKQIEVKLDGVRVIVICKTNGSVELFSRNGKPFHNFGHIAEQLSHVASTYMTEDMVLDGEVMSDNFQDLMKQVHRKDNVNAGDAVLHLFDMLTLQDFLAGGTTQPQSFRSTQCDAFVEKHADELPHVKCLSYEVVDLDTEAGQQTFKAINQRAIDGGYEGIMIKDMDADYKCKRSHAWLKMKPFIEVSLEVKSLEEGTGRNVGKLGALVCEGKDDGKTIATNVGSGLTDNNRDIIWADQQSVIGQIVEIRADAVTQNQDGTYSLRFPRFLRFRGFEVGEKI